MHLPRALAVVTALAALAAPALAAGASAGPSDRSFVGTDGATYPSAPLTVEGKNGWLYYGPDFDVACGLGAATVGTLRRIGRLAKVIERSGRTVVWAVAPDKTAVHDLDLPDPMPHGACDVRGLADTGQVLGQVSDARFLPLRDVLASSPRQTYYLTDTHWTTVGGSLFAEALAQRLDPRVARRQRYAYGTEQRLGILSYFAGSTQVETAQTARPTTRVRSRTSPASVDQDWSTYPQITFDYAWDTRPANRTIPGRTVILGDSFTMFALDSLIPLFRHGRFLWREHVTERAEFRAVARADTVVIEVAQVLAPLGSSVADPAYRARLARYLVNAGRA